MPVKKISYILEYTAYILRKYNELKRVGDNNIYRIADIKEAEFDQCKVLIQVIGKSSIFESSPHDLVTNDRLLEGFSKMDVRTITYLACNEIKKPQYKIVKQDFSGKFNAIVFKLKETKSEALITKTANQIVIDKEIVKNLSNADVSCISYIAGYECSQNKNV